MSLKSKRICKCCGKEYEYCPHCGSKSDELWKHLTDTKECLAVFNIVAAYNVGRANAAQVKKVLKENNITDYSTFKDSIVAVLDKVFAANKSPVVKKPVVMASAVVEKVEPTAPHILTVEPVVEEVKNDKARIEEPQIEAPQIEEAKVEEPVVPFAEATSAPL